MLYILVLDLEEEDYKVCYILVILSKTKANN